RRQWPRIPAGRTPGRLDRRSSCARSQREPYLQVLSFPLAAGLVEVLMHEGDGHAALAYRSGDALDGTEPDVSTGEDARDARLQKKRVPVELPPSGGADVGAGEHVALRVARDLRRKPGGRGVGTDEDEQPARLAPGRLACRGVADVDRLQRGVAMRRDHL